MNGVKNFHCDTCNKDFSSKGNLTQHLRTNKSCLWARDIKTIPECNFCNAKLTKTNYEEHIKNCTFKIKVPVLIEENQILKEENKLQKEKIILLEERIKSLTKPNNVPYLLPLTKEHIIETVKNTLKALDVAVIYGPKELGIYAGNFVFKDRVFCSCVSRYTVQFIEETSNKRIIDGGCKLLTEKFIELISDILKDNIEQMIKHLETTLCKEHDYLNKIVENLREIMIAINMYKNEKIPIEFQRKFAAGVCSVIESYKYSS